MPLAPPARRPSGLEVKATATALRSATSADADTGPVTVDPARAVVKAVAAVTGTEDEVGDVIIPGAFTRTLASRTPKICAGHDWSKPIGRAVSIKEMLPGDLRLPARTGSGRPWPRAAGALIVEAKFNVAITAGKDALETARFYGPESAWSIGYRAVKSRQSGQERYRGAASASPCGSMCGYRSGPGTSMRTRSGRASRSAA